jgi:hypothetical protein
MTKTLLLSLLITGCTNKAADTASPSAIDGPTHTIWSGWNHTWGFLSHRVSLIQVKAGDGQQAESGMVGGSWSTGEAWSDDVNYRIHQQNITGNVIEVEHGETHMTVGPEGVAAATSIASIDDVQLVVLRGFEINTDTEQSDDYPEDYDPALGYTSRGFGMSVEQTGDSEITATTHLRWGGRDRDDMNGAIPHAQADVIVHWTAISGLTSSETVTFSGQQELPHSPPNSEQSGLSSPLDWNGHGVSAIRRFDLLLEDQDGGEGGDYIRSAGTEIQPNSSGTAPDNIAAEILTTSAIELGTMRMECSVDAVWIPLDPSLSAVEGVTISGTHAIGQHTVSESP